MTPRGKRILRRLAWASGLGLLVVGIGVPGLLSSPVGSSLVSSTAERFIEAPVHVETSRFWWTGLRLEGVTIEQPDASFGADDAVAVERVTVHPHITSWLFGDGAVEAHVQGARVLVVRNEDGTLNWDALLPSEPRTPKSPRKAPRDGPPKLPELGPALDVRVEDAEVSVRDLGLGTEATLTDVSVLAASNDDADLHVELKTSLVTATRGGPRSTPTPLSLEADWSSRPKQSSTAALTLGTLDLAPLAPLLAAFGAPITSLEGHGGGALNLTWAREGRAWSGVARSSGQFSFDDVVVDGVLNENEPLRLGAVTLRPELAWDLDQGVPDVSGLDLRAGPVRLQGSPPGDAALALLVQCDLDALSAMGLPLPEGLQFGGNLRLDVTVPPQHDTAEEWLTGPWNVTVDGGSRGFSLAGLAALEGVRIPPQLRLTLPARVDLTEGRYALDGASLSLGRSTLALSAASHADQWSTTMDLTLDAPFTRQLLSALSGERVTSSGDARIAGSMTLPPPAEDASLLATLSALRGALDITAPSLRAFDQRLAGLTLALGADDAGLSFGLGDGAQLNDGALAATVRWDPTSGATSVDVGLNDVQAGSAAISVLQYGLPLLSGLADSALSDAAAVDFASSVDLSLHLEGPLNLDAPFELLRQGKGSGSFTLSDGFFQPAESLRKLTELASVDDSRWTFSRVTSDFTIEDGFVVGPAIELHDDALPLGLSGRTSFDGAIEYTIDPTPWLERSDRGSRWLELLGPDALPKPKLDGSLGAPRVDVADLSRSLLENAGDALLDRLRDDPEDAVDTIRRWIKGDGGPPRSP